MGIKISGIKELQSKLNDLAKKQIPYAVSHALNQTVDDIKKAEIEEMEKVFDRPTPYTLNSIQVEKSRKDNLRAVVRLKDPDRLGTEHYLTAQIKGGSREYKGFEKALYRKGILPAGMAAVPARGAWLDSYGNIPRGEIVKILSDLETFSEVGYQMNRSKNRKSRGAYRNFRYFVMRRGGRAIGIYAREYRTNSIQPIIRFVSRASYKTRFVFFEVAKKIFHEKFQNNFQRSLEQAIKTAR